MSHALRTLAVAAVMAGLAPMAAQAAAVSTSLDMSFEAGKWTPGTISDFVTGVHIANAKLSLLSSGRLALTNAGVDPITITIDKDLFHLNALSLDYFSGFSVGISINQSAGQALTSSKGQWKPAKLQRICQGNVPTCNPDVLIEGTDNWITSIEFAPDLSNPSGIDIIGLNGLNFTQIDATGGNNGGTVPEPAGYGLAALALLAAGAASRRRSAR